MIDIAGIDKAVLLHRLHANATALCHHGEDRGVLSLDECRARIVARADHAQPKGGVGAPLFFTFVHGRTLMVHLDGDQLDETAYDRLNGAGTAQKAVDECR